MCVKLSIPEDSNLLAKSIVLDYIELNFFFFYEKMDLSKFRTYTFYKLRNCFLKLCKYIIYLKENFACHERLKL